MLNSIFTFIFVFALLIVIKYAFWFIAAMKENTRMNKTLSDELIFGVSFSYIITVLINIFS